MARTWRSWLKSSKRCGDLTRILSRSCESSMAVPAVPGAGRQHGLHRCGQWLFRGCGGRDPKSEAWSFPNKCRLPGLFFGIFLVGWPFFHHTYPQIRRKLGRFSGCSRIFFGKANGFLAFTVHPNEHRPHRPCPRRPLCSASGRCERPIQRLDRGQLSRARLQKYHGIIYIITYIYIL